MTQKKSVGLQLLSKDQHGEIFAILQVRAKWNTEKDSPETYPGACQATVHGKLEEGENFTSSLLREAGEELGKDIAPAIKELLDNRQLVELVNIATPEKHVITYGGIIGEAIFQKLLNKKNNQTSGEFRIIKKDDVNKIVDLRTFDKTIGITDKNIIAMFPDEKEAVQLAFDKLSI